MSSSRPTRMASAKLKTYAGMDDSDNSDTIVLSGGDDNSDDDDSFDEDPDKIEIPGGGTSLEHSMAMATESSSSANPVGKGASSSATMSSLLSGGGGSGRTSNHHHHHHHHQSGGGGGNVPNILKGTKGYPKYNLPLDTIITPSSFTSASQVHQHNQGAGGTGAGGMNPSSLFDPSLFLSNPFNTNPMDSLNSLSQLLSSFPKMDSVALQSLSNNPLFQFYGMFAGGGGGNSAAASMMSGMGQLHPQQQHSIPSRHQQIPGYQLWNNQMKVKPEPEEEVHEEDETLGVAETYADYTPAKLKIGKPHPDPIVETASLASVAPPSVYYQLRLPTSCINRGQLSALQLEAIVYACQQHEYFLDGGDRAGYLIGDGAGVGKGRTIAGIIHENWLCGRKKALWVSVSADLKEDSIRDLKDIGAGNIKVFALNRLKYGKIRQDEYRDGVLFSTYSGLIGESSSGGKFNARLKQIIDWLGKDFDGVIVFDECHRAKNLCPVGNAKPTKTGVTVQKLQQDLPKARIIYASATGASEPKNMAYMTRLGIWGKGTPFMKFSDFINAVEKRGIGAMEIVAMDMKLRGAYIARQLSFKGVAFRIEEVALSEDFQLMYNESVDLWVESMHRFIEAAELMKADNAFRKTMWAQFWASHQRFFKYLCIAGKVDRAIDIAREAVKDGKCVVIGLQSTGEARTAEQVEREGELDDFVSTAKGVFQNLVEKHLPAPDRLKIQKLLGIPLAVEEEPQPGSSSSKGKPMRRAAQNAAKRARFNDSDASSNDDADSDFSAAGSDNESHDSDPSTDSKASDSEFESVSSDLESDDDGKTGKGRKRKLKGKKKVPKNQTVAHDVPSKEALNQAYSIRTDLLEKIEKLGNKMPNNTLDHLIDELGGPTDVAEMTGRKMRLIQMENGKIEYQSRAESDVALDQINLTEKRRFMDGEKNIAIISEAASSGISLQSDRRAKNKRRRVHITLELPWSADRAIQQFGRTHRSNQVNAPEYVFLISDLAGEHRFASIVAKRLESLGALTHGDRRATETRDLSRFHIDNKYGKMALEAVMRYIMTGTMMNLPVLPPSSYEGDFRSDVAAGMIGVGLIVNSEDSFGTTMPEKDYHNMSKFLNRILGMHVLLQNSLFKFFTDTLTAIVANAKKQGRFDMGILNLGDSSGDKTSLSSTEVFNRKHATGSGKIELHRVIVERGVSWEEALQKSESLSGKNDGFYLANDEKNNKRLAVLVIGDDFPASSTAASERKAEKVRLYSVYRPSTGLQLRRETLQEVQNKYYKTTPEKAKKAWEDQYTDSGINCVHAFWSGNCKNKMANLECDIGKRQRTYFILSGSVLLCWDDVEIVMGSSHHNHKIQIVRVQFNNGMKFVGILIPGDCVIQLKARLKHAAELELNPVKKEEILIGDEEEEA